MAVAFATANFSPSGFFIFWRKNLKMGFVEILILSVALSMDAFAVALCKGLATPKVEIKHMAICGGWFGAFQALMPLIGYFLGVAFREYIVAVDHWIAFVLLAFIGINMIKEAFSDCEEANSSFAVGVMFTMAVATSIDALAAGISMAMDDANIWLAVSLIGVITFALSALGVKVGNIFGSAVLPSCLWVRKFCLSISV